jgi:ribose transport system substrate-binding protein
MKQTKKTIKNEVAKLKKKGLVKKLKITDAQGNSEQQIKQIESMINSNYDAILVEAGSSTALDRAISKACSKGIAVISFDSLVKTDNVTSKINVDQKEWGKKAAQWMVHKLHGKGHIIVMNGPSGVSVSQARRKGAQSVLKTHKGIKVLTETHTKYNVAPAQQKMSNLLYSYHHIDGVLSLSGAVSAGAVLAFKRQGRDLVPMTGENYRQFLELWHKNHMHGWATMQPNWLGALSVDAAVKALQGKDIPAYVKVPPTVIDNDNLHKYIARADKFPMDGYVDSKYNQSLFKKLLKLK